MISGTKGRNRLDHVTPAMGGKIHPGFRNGCNTSLIWSLATVHGIPCFLPPVIRGILAQDHETKKSCKNRLTDNLSHFQDINHVQNRFQFRSQLEHRGGIQGLAQGKFVQA